MSSVFALVDCNNFYASCEKLFRPDLANTPVVVLSNNDGCVVARSKEAKALGIKMGVPIFKIDAQIRQHGIQVFSSNYSLYADMSDRVMRTLEDMAPKVEIYSIDEAFLDITGIQPVISLLDFGRQVKNTIDRWIGITVCVGMAPTKTLAKLANHAAKKYPATQGVVDLTNRSRQRKLLSITPVEDIWGVGRRLSARLQAMGIHTALDLADTSAKSIRQHFSVVLERTVRELNGESCMALEQIPATKKQIICSRSFGARVTSRVQMRQAVCEHVARAAEKLRKERQQAKLLSVFIRTSAYQKNSPQYSNALSAELNRPSDDTRDLIQLAMRLLDQLWRDGYDYAKAGVVLSDFYDIGTYQVGLFDKPSAYSNSRQLMQVMDRINHSGRAKVFFARQGIEKSWTMKREHLSPAYTTRWNGLIRVS
ncbi:translesion error-prone DNA polymerase V subunit UmuC [Porticoccaceae bacterium]|jgi:DNA polymerase V|nr:translesion error-prone DNA polymerase V subunit UmuC [Porticoccaceae bacterium]MDA9569867.1 translesion error-prone DNA polymerase V subunit UmuC [Porticoccaceae bacterium]